MSLISEALRKARQEASERDARARGIAPPPGPAGGGPRPGLGTGIVVGAVVASIAALAGGAAVWWALGSGGSAPAPKITAAAATKVSSTQVELAPVATAPIPVAASPEPALAKDDTGPPPESAPATAIPRPPAAKPTPPPVPTPRDVLPPLIVDDTTLAVPFEPEDESPSTPSPRAAPDAAAGPREFGLIADLGYARLELGYLIYRPDDPFAEINGVEVHVGSRLEGFKVDAIGKTFVRLSDDRGDVLLRVR